MGILDESWEACKHFFVDTLTSSSSDLRKDMVKQHNEWNYQETNMEWGKQQYKNNLWYTLVPLWDKHILQQNFVGQKRKTKVFKH